MLQRLEKRVEAGEKESIEEAYEVASRLCHLYQRTPFLIILGDDEEGNYEVCYDGCESDSAFGSFPKIFLNQLRTELGADKKSLIADLWMKRVWPSTTKKQPPSYMEPPLPPPPFHFLLKTAHSYTLMYSWINLGQPLF